MEEHEARDQLNPNLARSWQLMWLESFLQAAKIWPKVVLCVVNRWHSAVTLKLLKLVHRRWNFAADRLRLGGAKYPLQLVWKVNGWSYAISYPSMELSSFIHLPGNNFVVRLARDFIVSPIKSRVSICDIVIIIVIVTIVVIVVVFDVILSSTFCASFPISFSRA